MTIPNRDITPADLADGLVSGPEWDAWLAENPEIAAEVEMTRRVRMLLAEMRGAAIAVPDGFEERLMARLREDRTLLDMIDLMISGIGRTILELLAVIFGLVPQAPQASAQTI